MTTFLDYCLRLKRQNHKAFVPYLLAGYPSKHWTLRLLKALEKAGASAVELGIPFSDPIADGPILQKANFKALQSGLTLDEILDTVSAARRELRVPVLLMGYTNTFLRMGWRRLAEKSRKAGVSGFIIADLPLEEAGPAAKIFHAHGLALNLLCAPTTETRRMKAIDETSTGFVYLIAVKGVTGLRRELSPDLSAVIGQARRNIKKPLYVGFGLSTPDQAAAAARQADGVILGSRMAAWMEEHENAPDMDKRLVSFLRPWLKAVNNSGGAC